ncbi:MAG TPA: hypothetical protein PLS70_13820 [Acidobacteriota bacterium]|nr:hypothetical protein [Acidobacteriota bacterium]
MEALFGVQRATRLREQTENLSPSERESRIIEELSQALKEIGGDFVHPFEFSNSAGTRISHYLLLVSKHPKAFNLWKEITAKVSSSQTQGVASFEFNPKAKKQRPLFDLEQPLDDLGEELLKRFAGQTLTVEQIFNTHNILSNRFILKNYRDILKKLEEEGKVIADPPAERRRKRKGEVTLADQTKIIFPE